MTFQVVNAMPIFTYVLLSIEDSKVLCGGWTSAPSTNWYPVLRKKPGRASFSGRVKFEGQVS